jgi:hypothetical protein
MSHKDDIKRSFIRPAITLVESEWVGHDHYIFEINPIIWLDQNLPSYRVAIPEKITVKGKPNQILEGSIETRMLDYRPTGKIYYDASKPHHESVIWEYVLTGYPPVEK